MDDQLRETLILMLRALVLLVEDTFDRTIVEQLDKKAAELQRPGAGIDVGQDDDQANTDTPQPA